MGETGSKCGRGPVKLSDVYTRELARFQNLLISSFMLVAYVVGGGIREFMNNPDGPTFLERELVGLGMDRSEFTTMQVEWCPFTRFEII